MVEGTTQEIQIIFHSLSSSTNESKSSSRDSHFMMLGKRIIEIFTIFIDSRAWENYHNFFLLFLCITSTAVREGERNRHPNDRDMNDKINFKFDNMNLLFSILFSPLALVSFNFE